MRVSKKRIPAISSECIYSYLGKGSEAEIIAEGDYGALAVEPKRLQEDWH